MKRPTLSDIAREAGVSRSSAARVILGTGGDHVRVSEETRQRIEMVAERLQYTPNRFAQQLRGISSKTIGVILDTVNTPVMSERLFALEAEASQRGYRLLVGHTHGHEGTLQEYTNDFLGRGTEAILCLFDLAPGRDERVQQCFGKFRQVVFHARPAWERGYCVRVDTEAAVTKALDHLFARGKKFPALALGHSATDELVALRRRAFEHYLQGRGLQGHVWEAASREVIPVTEILDRGIDEIIGRVGADAILASNDVWATRFILQLQKRGLRVPDDVAVIGYDNLDIASVVSPSLTTVDQEHKAYARAAIELLCKLSENEKIPLADRVVTVEPQLVVREST